MAAVLLARSPEVDARQALAAALDDDAPAVRAAAAVAILGDDGAGGEGLEPERAESCLGSLATGDVAARAASLDALRRLRRPLADALLASCVADPSPEVRAAAMSALENTVTPNAADALVAGLSDPSARVRVAAATTLAARPDVDPRVVDLLGTTDAITEAAAIAALAGHGELARDRILAWADDEVTHALALSGARLDLRAGGPPNTPDFAFLCSVLDHRVLHAETMALGAMTALGAPAAGGVIRRSLGSADPDVRAQAIEALDSIGDRRLGRSIARLIEDAPSAQLLDASTVLTRLRDDDDPWIRVLARRMLPSGVDVTETDHVTSDIATMLQLRRVPLFERLSPEDLQRIAAVATERWFEEDAALVREGEAGDELFVILAGPRSRHPQRGRREGADRADLRRGRPHRGVGGPPRAPTDRDRRRRWRRRADPGHRRRGSPGHPARAPGRRDGDARDPCRADQRTVMTARPRRARRPPDRNGHLPAHGCPGLDGARAGARRTLGRSQPTTSRADRPGGRAHGGITVRTEGDALFAAFPEAIAAVEAAAEAQRAVATEEWPDDVTIQVRIGLHTGEAHRSGDDYGGFDVNRAARVAAVGHGGQVVLSETTATLVADALPHGTSLRDLGRHVLKDVPRAERLSQLDIAGLPNDFPPLRSSAERLGNLPDRLTSFVGRDQELGDLVELAQDARLVTLTGPGGIGKTSLAIEAARVLEPRFRDGAWLVSLAALDSPDQVRAAIAHGIGIFDGPERSAASAVLSFIAEPFYIFI